MLTMIEVEIDRDGRVRPPEPLPLPLLGCAYLALLPDPSANRTPTGATAGTAADALALLASPRVSPDTRSAIQTRCSIALRHTVRTGSTIDTPCLSRYLHRDLPDRGCGVVQRADTPMPGTDIGVGRYRGRVWQSRMRDYQTRPHAVLEPDQQALEQLPICRIVIAPVTRA